MKRFEFSAEMVLRQKSWLEQEAQRKLGVELNKLELFQQALLSVETEITRYLQQRLALPHLDVNTTLIYLAYDRKLGSDKMEEVERIQTQQMIVKKKTAELNSALAERKKLEKLKDREFAAYKKDSLRKETFKMDEVSANFYDRSAEKI